MNPTDSITSLNSLALQRLKQLKKKRTQHRPVNSESGISIAENLEVHITQHAYKRAKQRLRWKKTSLLKMFTKSMEHGLCQSQFSGQFGRYLRRKLRAGSKANRVLIYGEVIFFVYNNTLLTVYQLPTRYHGYLKDNPAEAA